MVFPRLRFGLVCLLLLLFGCGEPAQVTEYTIPKAPESQTASTEKESEAPAQPPAIPTYDVPADWVKAPDKQFSVDTYKVAKGDQEAVLTVSPLPLLTDEGVLANLNRWRAQVNMPPLRPGEEKGALTTHSINGVKVRSVKLANEPPQPGEQAVLVACFDHGGATWYFKLSGDAELTLKEEQNFLNFVQSIRFDEQ